MTIHDKLTRLTRFSSKAAVSKAAGLGGSTLGTILFRRSAVTIKAAAGLARVLGVDVAWLVDDSKGWPPVRVEHEEPVDAVA